MKTIIIFLSLSFLVSSCKMRQVVYSYQIADYRKYTEMGFFVTESNSVSFNYDPIGSVAAVMISGYKEKEKKQPVKAKKPKVDDLYGHIPEPAQLSLSGYIKATPDGTLESLYNQAKSLGADALINLKIEYMPPVSKNITLYDGYKASGMAIKRNNNP